MNYNMEQSDQSEYEVKVENESQSCGFNVTDWINEEAFSETMGNINLTDSSYFQLKPAIQSLLLKKKNYNSFSNHGINSSFTSQDYQKKEILNKFIHDSNNNAISSLPSSHSKSDKVKFPKMGKIMKTKLKLILNKIKNSKRYNLFFKEQFNKKIKDLSKRNSITDQSRKINNNFLAHFLMLHQTPLLTLQCHTLDEILRINRCFLFNKIQSKESKQMVFKNYFTMYEDFLMFLFLSDSYDKKFVYKVLSDYLNRSEQSLKDHYKNLKKLNKEINLSEWFKILIEIYIGQFSQCIRINYKKLEFEPYLRSDGYIIRYSFFIDIFLLQMQISNRITKLNYLIPNLYTIIKQFASNKFPTLKQFIYNEDTYIGILKIFELHIQKNFITHKKIYLYKEENSNCKKTKLSLSNLKNILQEEFLNFKFSDHCKKFFVNNVNQDLFKQNFDVDSEALKHKDQFDAVIEQSVFDNVKIEPFDHISQFEPLVDKHIWDENKPDTN